MGLWLLGPQKHIPDRLKNPFVPVMLVVFGLASEKVFKKIPVTEQDLEKTALDFLREHSVPVASSCFGEGVCKKCVLEFQGSRIFACSMKISEIMKAAEQKGEIAMISIGYI